MWKKGGKIGENKLKKYNVRKYARKVKKIIKN